LGVNLIFRAAQNKRRKKTLGVHVFADGVSASLRKLNRRTGWEKKGCETLAQKLHREKENLMTGNLERKKKAKGADMIAVFARAANLSGGP